MLELLNDSIGIKGAIGIFSIMHKRLDRHLKDASGHFPIIHERLNLHLNDAMGCLSIIPKRLNRHLKDAVRSVIEWLSVNHSLRGRGIRTDHQLKNWVKKGVKGEGRVSQK